MLKKLTLLIILTVFTLCGCGKKENKANLYQSIIKKDKLTVGTSYDSKPFCFKDSDGEIKGVDADIAREIAKKFFGSDKKIVFKKVADKDRIDAITSGDVDIVISAMTITTERKKKIDFSNSYFTAGQAICVKKTSNIESIDDLNNKKVIVMLGTTAESNIRDFIPNAIVQGYVNATDAFNQFKNGEAEAIINDDSLLLGFVIENDDYKILPGRLTKEPYGIAFKKNKGAASLKTKINKILYDIRGNGKLETIKDKWGVS